MNLEAVNEFKNILDQRILIYDGAMGTKLIAKGLTSQNYGGKDGCSEALNLFSPEVVKEVHKDYINAGCDVIETNTFGGTRITLKEYGLADKVREVNTAAVKIAKDAIAEAANGRRIFIAASIGPTSQLPSLGAITFDDMAAAYTEQFEALFDAGIDILQIETCQDLLQIKSALYAAERIFEKRNWICPVVVSVTLESNGKMLVGTDLTAVAATLEPYEFVDMLGINCSTGPLEMVRHVALLSKCWKKAIGVMPNAGLPDLVDGKPVYSMTPEEFASYHVKFVTEYGTNMAGGCCGTNEKHLKAVVEALKNIKPTKRVLLDENVKVSSMFSAVDMRQFPAPTLIGERTNTNGAKKFRDYLANEDFDGMTAMGKEQVKNGAHLVDLCVAFAGRNEVNDLKRLVPMFALQVNLPLVIDSTSPEAIETALKLHGGRCVINSVNFEDGGERLYKIAKIAKRFGALLICLTIDEEGMAKTAEKKYAIAKRLRNVLCDELGFKESDLIFDPLTFTVAGDAESRNAAVETLKALKLISENMPQANTVLGLSNVSFGLKAASREILNSVFVVEAVKNGLKSAIINPAKIIPVNTIPEDIKELALNLIYNKNNDGSDLMKFMKALEGQNSVLGKKDITVLPLEEQLKTKVVESDASGLSEIIENLVKTKSAEDIVNNIILPGMKEVGDLFGSGVLQLPFVLQSAEIVKKSVDLLKPYMKKNCDKSENKFILATVAGDVHDIGKNLVNIMVSNNGFEVIDLGIRVDIDTMIKSAQENGVNMIGMSGLLVRSTVIMKENLEELNRRNFLPDVILGGAALTEDYVEKELKPMYKGRVFYAADAIDTAKILMQLVEEKKNRQAN